MVEGAAGGLGEDSALLERRRIPRDVPHGRLPLPLGGGVDAADRKRRFGRFHRRWVFGDPHRQGASLARVRAKHCGAPLPAPLVPAALAGAREFSPHRRPRANRGLRGDGGSLLRVLDVRRSLCAHWASRLHCHLFKLLPEAPRLHHDQPHDGAKGHNRFSCRDVLRSDGGDEAAWLGRQESCHGRAATLRRARQVLAGRHLHRRGAQGLPPVILRRGAVLRVTSEPPRICFHGRERLCAQYSEELHRTRSPATREGALGVSIASGIFWPHHVQGHEAYFSGVLGIASRRHHVPSGYGLGCHKGSSLEPISA
mmetsp:Transcript_107613/g.303042  ORF Transcript_107613/g.303042 Transcript_107613/m.303042 type:complete len:312 (-) Transcript_107613:263-1198(-)